MINIQILLFYGVIILLLAFFLVCVILIITSQAYPVIFRSKKEKYFIDPATGKSMLFPTISELYSIHLSVVIPAYNEELRLSSMLEECVEFLENRCEATNFRYEIILVSDGSTDNTVKIGENYASRYGVDKIRILNLQKNRGKGGAVRLGVLSSRGAMVLFADADGATKFSELEKLENSLLDRLKCNYTKHPEEAEKKLAISIGSRAHLEEEAIATRSFFRTFLMYGFHFLVWLFAVRSLKDTQCGFKLFTREAARICFESIHIERWAFDVELLYIAQTLNIPITEVSVNWTEIEGSKLTPLWSSIQMGKDLLLIWLRYRIGAWKILKQNK